MHRAVIFTSCVSWVPGILIRAALSAMASRDDMSLVAVCVPKPQSLAGAFCIHLVYRTIITAESLFDRTLRHRRPFPWPINLARYGQTYRFKVIVPPDGDINHPDFIARLRDEIRPTLAFSFYCLQKFSPDLLAVFGDAVNYHNGLLPRYGGLKATAWSVYNGEAETGFTFHRMTEAFDAGAILMQATVPTLPNPNTLDLEAKKANTAAARMPLLLEKIAHGDSGAPQCGEAGYFSKKDYLAVTRIHDPTLLSSVELMRRLQAFGGLWIRLNTTWHSVTKMKPVCLRPGTGVGRLCVKASDGVILKCLRFKYLPYALYVVCRWIGERLRWGPSLWDPGVDRHQSSTA